MKRLKILSVLLGVILVSGSLHAQENLTTLTDKEKKAAIDTLCVRLNRFYVFPGIAKQMEKHVKSLLSKGAFKKISDPNEFAKVVTDELQSVCHDRHLRLFLGANPDLQPRQDPARTRVEAKLARESRNYGIDKVEILPGNVGCMRIRSVGFSEEVKEIISASLKFLSRTNAIIFDLRNNSGGDPSYMAFFFNPFFDKPTHINSIYRRVEDQTDDFRTEGPMPGMNMSELPLYVLIGPNTFSGGEEFAYDLQALKRATIVGGTSAGGANPATTFALCRDLRAAIPYGRAVNPVTKTNWEGTGVRPDVEVPVDSALAVATRLAREAGRNYRESKTNAMLSVLDICRSGLAGAEGLFDANKPQEADSLAVSAMEKALRADVYNENLINALGYDFLNRDKFLMAISIFGFNARAFPNSSNVYDSLGEAYIKNGRTDLAILNYRRSLELDPGNANAREALEKLKSSVKK